MDSSRSTPPALSGRPPLGGGRPIEISSESENVARPPPRLTEYNSTGHRIGRGTCATRRATSPSRCGNYAVLSSAALRGGLVNAWIAETGGVCYATLAEALRAADRGGTETLITNTTAPLSLVAGRTIVNNGHILVTFDDTKFTLMIVK